jgi:uncharacterized protein (UPF0332 family)
MSLNDENRKDVVLYRIERAYTALEQAKLNVEINCLEVIANRLYYAAYYAVSALLIAYQIPAHTHEGNIQQFGLHFVKNGIVSRDMGKFYSQLFEMRLKGDYSDRFGLTDDEVVPKIQPTAAFIKQVSDLAKAKLEL